MNFVKRTFKVLWKIVRLWAALMCIVSVGYCTQRTPIELTWEYFAKLFLIGILVLAMVHCGIMVLLSIFSNE